MTIDEKLYDLQTVLEADAFTSENGKILLNHNCLDAVTKMRKLLRRDKDEIRHCHDQMGIKYRQTLQVWLGEAGKFLRNLPLDTDSFHHSYQQFVAFYAGKVVDELPTPLTTLPNLVQQAHRRYQSLSYGTNP